MVYSTYLGNKGYTVSKKELTPELQDQIRKDLTVKPFTPGSPLNNISFSVYRESANKIYVPHYYGVEKFGNPTEIKITEGDDISVSFNGILRDYQAPVIEKFISYLKKTGTPTAGLLELFCAWGKTSGAMKVISEIGKKALVIVHKEFLMNQWIERIAQFLPTARVGKIQGQTIDIENKDIVICMLQSLVLKDYPPETFNSFGITIIDEVHHISSQTFSTALFKIVTKYMLGLSATMDRKDGTTKVFKMFLGEVFHKAEKKGDHEVEVRAVTYKTNDDEFNETILDYKGQPQISSMISKLCSYNRRTEFIIKVLNDFIKVDDADDETIIEHKQKMDDANPACGKCNKKNNYLMKNTCCDIVKYCLPCLNDIVEDAKIPEKSVGKDGMCKQTVKRPKCPDCKKVLKYEQHYIENLYVKPLEQTHTIVMSHNLNILEYMYTKFVCKNYASVGYYVGGMSEQQLKQTEKKQVIFASYSMCSEGLDIPTLNAEFLITPKTDVIQIVGRILRAKHAFANPIIYDFVDSHDVFERQWLKRKAYFKKQNYKIIGTDSIYYQPDTTQWKIIVCPKSSNKSREEGDEVKKDPLLSGKCFISIKK